MMRERSKHRSEAEAADSQAAAQEFVPLPRRQVVLAMASAMLAMFLAALNQTVVVTALPGIVSDLGGFDRYSWVATAYIVALAVAVPVTGRLSDIYGRKAFFILGISVFILGSALCGLSQSMTQLIAARVVHGLGGGIIVANSFIAVADLFPPHKRGRHQGWASSMFGVAAVVGPVLGGAVTDHFAWNGVFLVNVPLGLLALLLIARLFPKIAPKAEDRKLDLPGMGVLTLAVASTLTGLSCGGVQYAWGSWQVVGALGFGLAMAAVFVRMELRSDAPIMPMEVYRGRTAPVALTAVLLASFGLFSCLLFVPLLLQAVQGLSATESGVLLLPIIFGVIFGSMLFGRLLSGMGEHYRTQALVGTGIMMASMYLMAGMDADASTGQTAGWLFMLGFGAGGTFSTFNVAIQNSAPFRLLSIAVSAMIFCRMIGAVLGTAISGVVMTTVFLSRLEASIPESLQAALPAGWLDSVRDNPGGLFDPTGMRGPQAGFPAFELYGEWSGLLDAALAEAIASVFATSALVAALAFAIALFLKMPNRRVPS